MLDFSNLSDDQLVELLRAAMNEASARGEVTRMAANSFVIDAQEKAEIEAKVAAKAAAAKAEAERKRIEREAEAKFNASQQKSEQDKISNLWQAKKSITLALEKWGIGEAFELSIWSRGADRRVYFQSPNSRNGWKICLYVTGNAYHPPSDFEKENYDKFADDNRLKADESEDWKQLKSFLSKVAEFWKGDLRLSSTDTRVVKEFNVKHYESYCKALELKEVLENV